MPACVRACVRACVLRSVPYRTTLVVARGRTALSSPSASSVPFRGRDFFYEKVIYRGQREETRRDAVCVGALNNDSVGAQSHRLSTEKREKVNESEREREREREKESLSFFLLLIHTVLSNKR